MEYCFNYDFVAIRRKHSSRYNCDGIGLIAEKKNVQKKRKKYERCCRNLSSISDFSSYVMWAQMTLTYKYNILSVILR